MNGREDLLSLISSALRYFSRYNLLDITSLSRASVEGTYFLVALIW